MLKKLLITASLLCLCTGMLQAETLEVGTGVNSATVMFEWSDGFSLEFLVNFGEDVNDTTTGLGLLDIIEANSDLTSVRLDYGWGEYVNGIAYQDHNDLGYNGDADWWHYWENDEGSQNLWVSSSTGASGRTVSHGDTDAWIYGSDDEPEDIDVIEVGDGINDAQVFFEWSDGFTLEFLVHFGSDESDTLTGLEILDIIETESDLNSVRVDSSWGTYIDGISYDRHSNPGYVSGSDWWHYWVNDAGSRTTWTSSSVGASSRVLGHGDADGWIYGHDDAPVPASVNPYLEGYGQYVFNASDFATSVIDYTYTSMGSDWLTGTAFDDPCSALGRPTVDSTGDNWYIAMDEAVPVVPVYPAFRAYELVFLGEEGQLTLGFDHPVRDDENNPYGIDVLVYGNAMQVIGSGGGWTNGDPTATTVSGSCYSEPGVVSVSQDGLTWYSFTTDANFMSDDPNYILMEANEEDGPFCDNFAATLGRVYDPCYVDANLGDWNLYWAEATNPTLPLDPDLTAADFASQSVARMAQNYGDSAGGTGYDIDLLDLPTDPNTGLKWFQYIRIDDQANGGSAEVDAVADVSCPGDYLHPAPTGDLNGDFQVDEDDVTLAESLLGQTADSSDEATAADLDGDGVVDQDDVDTVSANLGQSAW